MERQSDWPGAREEGEPAEVESNLELPAEERAAHAPPRRVTVEEELRSVVIAELDDEDRTPLCRSRCGSSPDLEVHEEADELDFDFQSIGQVDSVRPLPTYDHRNDPTIVLPRRQPRSRLVELVSQLAPQQFYAVVFAVVITGCAAAFIIGAAITSLFSPVPPLVARPVEPVAAPPPASALPASGAGLVDVPVTLTDLPVASDEEDD